MRAATTAVLARLGEATNRTIVLPVVMFSPTERCNSRCVSCGWWRAGGEGDLSLAEIDRVASSLAELGTRLVVFTGGEPLVRADVFEVARLFRRRGIALHLLTSGIGIEPRAAEIGRLFERVIVSLDSATREGYAAVRGIDGLPAVCAGVRRLKAVAPHMHVSARSTMHRRNFREMPAIVTAAKAMGLDGVSFLAADLTSPAFGRRHAADVADLRLDRDDARAFGAVVEDCIASRAAEVDSGFIAEPPAKLRRLPQYYAALHGDASFPPTSCNAPWVSAVIEADGTVRPCFFHRAVGNVRSAPLSSIVRDALPEFRSTLDVSIDPVCERCVCTLKVGWRSRPWA